jgi:hypothetical protein
MELDSGIVYEIGGFPNKQRQEIESSGVVHEEMLDESTLRCAGYSKQLAVTKVYYELDSIPRGAGQGTATEPFSSISMDTTIVGSPLWLAAGTIDGPSPIPPKTEIGAGDNSPIPQTPLRYYGEAALPGRPGRNGWIGRPPSEVREVRYPE